MSAGDPEEMAAATDLLPACPVKVVEYEGLSPFGPASEGFGLSMNPEQAKALVEAVQAQMLQQAARNRRTC